MKNDLTLTLTIKINKVAHRDIIEFLNSIPKQWRRYFIVDALKFYLKYRDYEKDILSGLLQGKNKTQEEKKTEISGNQKTENNPEIKFAIDDILKNI